MATLQKIRNRAGLLIGVLGLALLAFVLGDLFNSGGAWVNKIKDKAFVVNGDVVSTGAYFQRVEQLESFQKFMSGKSSLDENITAQIKEFVYDQMVKEMILDEQAADLGLAVSKEEINDMVYGEYISPVILQSPMFSDPQTGQFSRETLMQFLTYIQTEIESVSDEQKPQLAMYKDQWMLIENMMKYNRLEQKYNTLLTSAIVANDLEVKSNFEDSKYISDIAFVNSSYSLIPDSTVKVTDSELQKLYDERKSNFKTSSDLIKLSYIVKDVYPSEEDYEAVGKEINSVYEKLQTTANPALLVADYSEIPFYDVFVSEASLGNDQKAFVKTASVGDIQAPRRGNEVYQMFKLIDKTLSPDSVKLRIIAIPEGTDKVAAESRADSILNVINGGKAFEVVANELNPKSNGGDIGWVTEPMLASADGDLLTKSFSGSKGEIIRLSTGGFIQLFKVEDKTAPVTKYKVATVQMPVAVSDKTISAIDSELNQFIAENGNAKSFASAAVAKGYNFVPEMTISPADAGLPQVQGSRPVIHWAFNEKPGAINNFNLADQRVIALINSRIDKGYAPLSEVSDILKAELIMDKKAERIIADLKSKNATSLDAYSQVIGTRVDTVRFVNFATPNVSGLGREPIFNVYSKLGKVNELNGPVKGNKGVFVLSVINRADQDVTFDAQAVKQGLNSFYLDRVNPSMLMMVLKDKLGVEDNRVAFF